MTPEEMACYKRGFADGLKAAIASLQDQARNVHGEQRSAALVAAAQKVSLLKPNQELGP